MTGGETKASAETLHFVRVSFKALSPLSIGSGESRKEEREKHGSDDAATVSISEIQRDANGLPTVPGAGLQGVLRRLASESYGKRFAERMFGHEDAGGDGAAGRVVCGWACAHGADNRAVSGLRLPELDVSNDDVLGLLREPEPLQRDHVALNDRHSVDGRRRFARAAVPPGARFSVELSGWGCNDFRDELKKVVALFRHPRLRLGAGSGRGYGRLKLLAASYEEAAFDHPVASHRLRQLRQEPPSEPLNEDLLPLTDCKVSNSSDTDTVLVLDLKCADLLRIGASGPHAQTLTRLVQRARDASTGKIRESPVDRPETHDGDAASKPSGEDGPGKGGDAVLKLLREPRIEWDNDKGRVVAVDKEAAELHEDQFCFPIPGSSIRGALAHRMLFHANRLANRCINVDDYCKADKCKKALKDEYRKFAERDSALQAFLGAAKEAQEDDRQRSTAGRAGRVIFNDGVARNVEWIVAIDHVSIDRFTGGAMDGALFREEALLGGEIEAEVVIRPPLDACEAKGNVGGWPRDTAQAFLLAVRDLCTGRLALGGRGHGECSGKIRFEGGKAEDWCKAAESFRVPIAENGS